MEIFKYLLAAFLIAGSVSAQSYKAIKLSNIPASYKGDSILLVGSDGSSKSATITGKTLSITPTATSNRLYVRDDNGKITRAIVGPTCKTNKKTGKDSCTASKTALLSVKAGASFSVKNQGANLLAAKISDSKSLNKAFVKTIKASTSVLQSSIAGHGYSAAANQAGDKVVKIKADSTDSDSDGLVDAIDSDDDGDGTIDNYDKSTSASVGNTFKVFSNFKAGIENSINKHTTGLDKAKIDNLTSTIQSLAIQVSGNASDTVELDCGGLDYCSSGGTGMTSEGSNPFPGTAGGTGDPDGDGYGTITKGSTGDFQLLTKTTSDKIGSGDSFIEYVTDTGSTVTNYTGMLNFAFNSNPALKTLAVGSGAATTVDYSVNPIKGSPRK